MNRSTAPREYEPDQKPLGKQIYDPTRVNGGENEYQPEVYGPDVSRAVSNRVRRTTKKGKEESRGTAVNMSVAEAEEIKELANEELVANLEEIKEYEYLTNCMICQDFTFMSRDPQYCMTCQKSVFCKECIVQWLGSRNTCPGCNTKKPQMRSLADNKKLLGLLQTIKLYCRLRPMGCKDELLYN